MVTDVALEAGRSACGLTELQSVAPVHEPNAVVREVDAAVEAHLDGDGEVRHGARVAKSSTAGLAHASTVSRRTVAGTTTSPKRHTAARSASAKLSPVA